MKNSDYEMGFAEISVPFNEKIFKIGKSKVPDSKGKVSLFVTFIIFPWFYYFLIIF